MDKIITTGGGGMILTDHASTPTERNISPPRPRMMSEICSQ